MTNELKFTVSIFSLIVFPSFLMSANLATSMAMGTVFAAVIIFLLVIWSDGSYTVLNNGLPWVIFIIFEVMVHLLISNQMAEINDSKGLITISFLFVIVLPALMLAKLMQYIKDGSIYKIIKFYGVGLLMLGSFGCLKLFQPFSSSFVKPVFPFTEPSHFALLLTPLILFLCVVDRSKRFFYVFIYFLEAYFLQNLTMTIGAGIALYFSIRKNKLIVIFSLIFVSFLFLDLTYFTDRVNLLNSESNNISLLVYIQGWEMLAKALLNSYGMGIGFQQLGLQDLKVEATQKIYEASSLQLNTFDGGFTFSKIVSELGVFSLIFLLYYFSALVKSIKYINECSDGEVDLCKVFCSCIVVGYFLELFVRGAGYFTPTSFLMVSSMILIHKK